MPDDEDIPPEHLTPFEYYFYLTNGSVGTVLNLVVLFIALRHADTVDKPRQVGEHSNGVHIFRLSLST